MQFEISTLQQAGAFLVLLVGFYWTSKSNIERSEKRISILEIKVEHMEQKLMHHAQRLDNHDEQNRALISLTEQVKNLSEDMDHFNCLYRSLYGVFIEGQLSGIGTSA